MNSLKGKSITSISDMSAEELKYLVDLAYELKYNSDKEKHFNLYKHKSIILLFLLSSTRTRLSFEVAANELGLKVHNLDGQNSQYGKNESLEDSISVMSAYTDGIIFRGDSQKTVETLAKYSLKPVINAYTPNEHPIQMVSDFLTIKEIMQRDFNQIKLVFSGKGTSAMARSLALASAKLGLNLTMLTSQDHFIKGNDLKLIQKDLLSSQGSFKQTEDLQSALHDADIVYTDSWVDFDHDNASWIKAVTSFYKFQVNKEFLAYAPKDVRIMHCLPSLHNSEPTTVSSRLKELVQHFPFMKNGALEISDEVFRANKEHFVIQARNKIYGSKAALMSIIAE